MIKRLLIILILPLLLGGCFDKVEIDRKSIVSTIGFDKGEKAFSKLKVTYGFPDISELGPQKGTSASEKSISSEGYSFQDALSGSIDRTSRILSLGQSKILIISSELYKDKETIREVIDYITRNPEFNRMMYVIICDGKAENFIKHTPSMEKNIESYLSGLMESTSSRSAIVPVRLKELLRAICDERGIIIPKIQFSKESKEVVLKGGVFVQDNEIKGYFDNVEVEDISLLKNRVKTLSKVISFNQHPLDFLISNSYRTINLKSNVMEKLTFEINLEIEGEVISHYFGSGDFTKEKNSEIQNLLNQSIKSESERVVELTKNQLEIDALGVSEYLEAYHPFIWDENKRKWKQKFRDSEVVVNVNVKIKGTGIGK